MDRAELAKLLRRARARVAPSSVGLPAGERRRVPGLRREEVATLAGISVDYVVRLEQGRGPRPTPSVLAALARALRMSDGERNQLFELADAKLPRAGRIDLLVRASVQRLVDRLPDLPVLVLSAKGDVLAWNPMGAALLGDFSELPDLQRNLNWQRFLGDSHRVSSIPGQAAENERQSVARLRSAAARYPDDPDLSRLIDELRRGSVRFAELWEQAPTEVWVSHPKSVEHPELGPIVLDCDSMTLPESGQTVMVYSAEPGTTAHQQLDLLRVIGTQRMAESR